MALQFQARWVSRDRANQLKKSGRLWQAVLLDTFNGFLIVEPVGSDMGDGPVLSPEEATFELQEVWYTGPRSKLKEARARLGLETEAPQLTTSGA